MKIHYFLLFPFPFMYGQDLHHQMISSQGTSKVFGNGIYVSQTIGKQSVIGNYNVNGVNIG